MVELRGFGTLCLVEPDGTTVALGGGRVTGLAALLLCERDRGLSIERLVDELWPGHPPASVANAVRTNVSRLRRRLAGDGFERITRDGLGYRFVPAPDDEVDVLDFESLADRGMAALAAADHVRAAAALIDALDLWGGPPFGDVDIPQVDLERIRLEQRRVECAEGLGEALLHQGQHRMATAVLDPIARENPGRERLTAILVQALYRSGRQVDALMALDASRRWLAEELGLLPGPVLRDLEAQVLNHDPTLLQPPSALSGTPHLHAPDDGPAHMMVGRDAELTKIRTSLASTRSGLGGNLWITGPPGIGKSRLLDETCRLATEHGFHVLRGSADRSANRPLRPLWSALARASSPRVLAPLRRSIEDSENDATTAHATDLGRVLASFDALIASLTSEQPVLLVIDDAQWLDDTTTRVFTHAARSATAGLLVVVATREVTQEASPEMAPSWVELRATLAASEHNHHLALGALSLRDVRALASTTSDHDDPRLPEQVMSLSSGNPLVVQALLQRPDAVRDGLSPSADAAQFVLGTVFDRLLTGLPSSTLELLQLAALAGDTFEGQMLASATGHGLAQVGQELHAGVRSGVIQRGSEGPDSYRFMHDLIRQRCELTIGSGQKARLHLALARIHPSLSDPARALHLCEAVPEAPVTHAIDACLAAAEAALRSLSFDLARQLAQRALDVLDAHHLDDASPSVQVRAILAVALERLGEHPRALELYRACVEEALADNNGELAARAALRGALWGRNLAVDDPIGNLLESVLQAGLPLEPPTKLRATAAFVYMRSLHRPSQELERMLGDVLDEQPDGRRNPDAIIAEIGLTSGLPVAEHRLRLGRRLIGRSAATADRPNEAWLRGTLVSGAAALEIGRTAMGNDLLQRSLHGAQRARHPNYTMLAMISLAGGLQQSGDIGRADSLADECLEIGLAADVEDTMVSYSAFQAVAHFLRGELTALVGAMEQAAEGEERGNIAWRAVHALAMAETGDLDRATWIAEELVEQLLVTPRSVNTPIYIATTAELTGRLGHPELAGRVAPLAEPFAGSFPRTALVGPTLGPIDRQRALLARALGHGGEATRLFDQAEHLCRAAGSEPWLRQVERDRRVSPA